MMPAASDALMPWADTPPGKNKVVSKTNVRKMSMSRSLAIIPLAKLGEMASVSTSAHCNQAS
jgi:hypothetical protein